MFLTFSAWYVRNLFSLFVADEHARGTQVCYPYVRYTIALPFSTNRVLVPQVFGVRVIGDGDGEYRNNSVL